MNENNNIFYRSSGEFEQKGCEPLPPTKISDEAKKKLMDWGLTEEQIDYLRQFNSQFRYDLCAQKIDRLSKTKAEIFERYGREYINLPSFFDVSGRLDGQCGDIGGQWIIQMHKLSLLKIINLQRTDGVKIATCYYSGLSKTHFCQEGSNHVWNGLALLDKEGYVLDEIYFDAAFQSIMDKSESGYKQRTAVFNPVCVKADENATLPITKIQIIGSSWNGYNPDVAVLGVSNDFQFSYSLGFVRNKDTREITPIICRGDAKGNLEYFLYGKKNHLLFSNKTQITPEEEVEIRELLDKAKKIKKIKKNPTTNSLNWSSRRNL